MSNIGKQPIAIKNGVEISLDGQVINVKGPKGELTQKIPHGIGIEVEESRVIVKKLNQSKAYQKFYGLTRALVSNMVHGVADGFEKKLELVGVGYRARTEGRDLVLNVGFAHPVKMTPPEGVSVAVQENTIVVSGINKQDIGDFASKVRAVRPPEPYKGKGIKYANEVIRRKAGKAAKGSGE